MDKTKLLNDILSLLQIRDKGKEQQEMMDEWLFFIIDYKLSAMEIYHAHKMAMKRELFDDKGNEIECLPVLSINTTGKILSAYERSKKSSIDYQSGKQKLKKIMEPKKELTEAEREVLEKKFLKEEWERLQNNELVIGANIFYGKIKIIQKTISMNFVEEILVGYKPQKELNDDKRDKNIVSISDKNPLKKLVNISPISHFQTCVVMQFIEWQNLKNLSENDWIDYWKNPKIQKENAKTR